MIMEKLNFSIELASENTSMKMPAGKNMPLSCYTFMVEGTNHLIQNYTEGVVVVTSSSTGKTTISSNKPLNKINETSVRISF